jgi:hypothetical protein
MWRWFLVVVFLVVLAVEFVVRLEGVDWSTAADPTDLSWQRRGFLLEVTLRTYPWSVATALGCALLAWLPGRLFPEPSA